MRNPGNRVKSGLTGAAGGTALIGLAKQLHAPWDTLLALAAPWITFGGYALFEWANDWYVEVRAKRNRDFEKRESDFKREQIARMKEEMDQTLEKALKNSEYSEKSKRELRRRREQLDLLDFDAMIESIHGAKRQKPVKDFTG